jgi:hypothetical protein
MSYFIFRNTSGSLALNNRFTDKQARNQTMNTVGAAPSTAGASTYVRLYSYIVLMLYYTYILHIYINYVRISVKSAFFRTTESKLVVT